MPHRCAVLDDYQSVAMQMADWSPVAKDVEIEVFHRPLGDEAGIIRALQKFSIVCAMRERTLFSKAVFEGLPDLRLLVTTGMRNAAIDVAAARERNVTVCGTESTGHPTAELAFGLMLELARKIGHEHARLKAGAWWQETIGIDLFGKTLGIVGLGRLGSRAAAIGRAFGMQLVAWSQNLTEDKAREAGAARVEKDELFRRADFITIHLQLSPRTQGLVGAKELALMKPSAFLINTSRGPIVEEAALIAALRERRIAGVGLDVYDVEPLPQDHPLRKADNAVITPHLGYVTQDTFRIFYKQTVEDIRAFLDGKPVRVIGSK
jgi:phosphoglycerate dehydrogenase-like enzyme